MTKENGNGYAEEIHVEEDEVKKEGPTLTEEMQMAGEEVLDFVKKVVHEANVRRVTVKNSNGRVLLDIPVAIGAVGLLPPFLGYSLLALGAAVLTNCSVTIERVEEETEEADTPAE